MKKDIYLSKDYTDCLRGICAIIVVIHHLYQCTGLFVGTYIGKIFGLSGALAVSVFFFYSGYGLMLSATKKNYVQNFFRNRFLPLYCFYVILVILYSLWTLWIEHTIPLDHFVKSFFFGKTIVANGWYLQVTFILYLMFLFSFSIFKTPKTQMLVFAIFILGYCTFCRFFGLNVLFYQAVPCVILGMVYCYAKERIDVLLSKYAWSIFIVSSVVFAILCIFIYLLIEEPIFNSVYLLFFVCAVISFSYIVCDTSILNNSFFALCGKYSLEIYVSHGFFLRLISLNIITNKLIYILIVIVGTIIMSVIMKKIYTKIGFFLTKIA